MTREHGAKILIYGGSSCTFSVDGERLLEQFHLPVVNYGFGASLGPMVLTEAVMNQVRPGDTLIMAVEPGLLTSPFDPPATGIQFAFAEHHPGLGDSPGVFRSGARLVSRPRRIAAGELSRLHPGG